MTRSKIQTTLFANIDQLNLFIHPWFGQYLQKTSTTVEEKTHHL